MTAPQAPKTYGDEHKTAQQISQMPPAQQREYFEQYMSPEDRANCLQEIANTGTANQPFFAQIFARISADAKAQQQANQYGQQIVQQATGSDTQYVTGLSPSHADYQGIAHTDLQGYVDSGLDAGQIGTMSTGYHQMSSTFDQISTALNDAVNKSQSEWEGNAADSARGYFSSMQQWSDGNSQNARLASEVTYQQSTAAQTAKNTMPAPIPFSWSDEMKGWAQSNPFNLMDNVNASLQKAQASQDAHDQAAQVMSTYDNSLYGAASKQPVFTQPPKFDSSGGTGTGTISGSVGSTTASGYTGPTGGPGGGGGSIAGARGGVGSVGGVSSGSTGMPTLKTGSVSGSVGSTKAQGYQPPPSPQAPTGSGNSPAPSNGMSMTPMMGVGGLGGLAGGADAYSSKIGRGGGFGSGTGSGGSGSGSGAGSGSAPGEGARTGVRAGGAGAAEAAGAGGAAGARGAAGRSGASGMSGMGRGGKGEGSEDEEHQRPSWLVEADPDDVFGTSERTAPPVIGE
ncbi:MAG TPA: hypothetical protein VFG87_01660 [Amycolatopsis sp.]|nr:hypothetical protein [Amycolatopsis sp.]